MQRRYSRWLNGRFPHTLRLTPKIVADRFHVIRLVIDTLLDFSREAEPDIRWQRGIIAMLRKNGEHLSRR